MVLGGLSEALWLSHLTDPRFHGHEFITRTVVNLSEIIFCSEISSGATSLDFFDLSLDLGLFFISLLYFSFLSGLLSVVKTGIVSEVKLIIVFIRFSGCALIFLVLLLHCPVTVEVFVIIVDVGVPNHHSLVVATC